MTDDLCPVCNHKRHPGCRNGETNTGGGIIPIIQDNDEVVAVTCPNMARLNLRKHLEKLDPQLLISPHEENSPLYRTSPKDDKTQKNLLISVDSWGDFLPHLKWVAAAKGPQHFIRIVTDMTLLNVFVGATTTKSRVSQTEKDLLVANSLEDVLNAPDLVIIRLGHIIHFNKAAANVLLEALLIRQALGKPTWLLELGGKRFQPFRMDGGLSLGMVCCSYEARALVDKYYESLALSLTEGLTPLQTESRVVDNASDISLIPEDMLTPRKRTAPRKAPAPVVEDDPENGLTPDTLFGSLDVDSLVRSPAAKKFRKKGW